MKPLYFSVVIPVFNRPEEINRLLNSLTLQDDKNLFEVVVVEVVVVEVVVVEVVVEVVVTER